MAHCPVLASNPIVRQLTRTVACEQHGGVLDKGRTVEVPLRSDAGTNLVRHSHAEARVTPSERWNYDLRLARQDEGS
jgi:hypothetical protein